ncbi:MAG: hypothetical protein QF384_00035 [Alphaproteobacteria bacterium]|jgi:quinol monooxygenase YgiN|nr:hypothetical protein [Alphaproteobacteria bacterium]MDP6687863.1 hypothetical protein [Alphaproteobacteria bacterium]
MHGIVIEYDLSGDQADWRRAVETFLKHIDDDPRLQGRFRYQVNRLGDGDGRLHIGHWDNEETLAHLQAQPFFRQFAAAIQEFAAEPPKATRFQPLAATAGTAAAD